MFDGSTPLTQTLMPSPVLAWGPGSLNNPAAHGLTEMLYEFTSASANNGSGFEGLGDNTPFWNLGTGVVMLTYQRPPNDGDRSAGLQDELEVDGQTREGRITFVASKAEFTPRNVQTQSDRAKTVFAVKVRLPNPDLRLKPGMFADATL